MVDGEEGTIMEWRKLKRHGSKMQYKSLIGSYTEKYSYRGHFLGQVGKCNVDFNVNIYL